MPEEKIANDLNYEYDHKNIGEVSCEKVGKDMHTRESCRQHGGFNSGDLGRNLLGKNAGIHCNDKEPSGIALNSDSSDFDDDVDDDYNTDLDGFLAADDEDDSVRCDRERAYANSVKLKEKDIKRAKVYSLLDDSDEESDKDASLKCKHADVGSSSSSSLSLPDEDQEAQKRQSYHF